MLIASTIYIYNQSAQWKPITVDGSTANSWNVGFTLLLQWTPYWLKFQHTGCNLLFNILDDKTDKRIVGIDKFATKHNEINLLTEMPHILGSELKYHEQGANFEYNQPKNMESNGVNTGNQDSSVSMVAKLWGEWQRNWDLSRITGRSFPLLHSFQTVYEHHQAY